MKLFVFVCMGSWMLGDRDKTKTYQFYNNSNVVIVQYTLSDIYMIMNCMVTVITHTAIVLISLNETS